MRPFASVLVLGLVLGLSLAAGAAGCTKSSPRPAVAAKAPSPASPTPAAATAAPVVVHEPTDAEVCTQSAGEPGEPVPGAAPFTREDPHCGEKDPFCDWVQSPPDRKDTCFVATTNLARAERESHGSSSSPVTSAPWDGKTAPRYLDRVDGHLHLDAAEQALLHKNGFVAFDRLEYESYANAYHDVFQQQLPVFVSIDSILNAVFQANGSILQHIETSRLGPKLAAMLVRLEAGLKASRGVYDRETLDDLDIYVTVAKRLFWGEGGEDGKGIASVFGHDEGAVATLGSEAESDGAGLEETALFGRPRVIDFSQFVPRGHYANVGYPGGMIHTPKGDVGLDHYFRAMMWLSRLELNLVSRSCRSSQPGEVPDPSETPREARDAIALADLAARAGVLGDLREFDKVYTLFAGTREDVSLFDLLALMKQGGIQPRDPDAPAKLKAAIGNGFQRTARIHYMPQGATVLPVIATLFGPRIVPDIAPLTRLVHDQMPDRYRLGAADVAVVLGHAGARRLLADDLAKFPTLGAALDQSRADLRALAASKKDLYGLWLSAVARLADPIEGAGPSFTKSPAYADMRMNSALVGYGQIRHNYVLLAGQGYDSYGCEIPDGYVEPALGTYDALLAYVRAASGIDVGNKGYWRRVEEVLSMLRAIVVTELSGAPLSEPQRRWLGMVAEYIPVGGYGDSGEPPKWTGWYFDLFPDREIGATKTPVFIADYFTLTNVGEVRYLGAERPRLGAFVVDVDGAPRMMVGPVAKGYEVAAPIQGRLNDETARKAAGKSAPWLASYLAPDVADPPMRTRVVSCDDTERVWVGGPVPLGDVTVTLLDHHGDPVAQPVTRPVGTKGAVFAFRLSDAMQKARHGVEGLHVYVHDVAASGQGSGRYDVVAGVNVFPGWSEEGLDHPSLPFGSFVRGDAGAPPAPPTHRGLMLPLPTQPVPMEPLPEQPVPGFD